MFKTLTLLFCLSLKVSMQAALKQSGFCNAGISSFRPIVLLKFLIIVHFLCNTKQFFRRLETSIESFFHIKCSSADSYIFMIRLAVLSATRSVHAPGLLPAADPGWSQGFLPFGTSYCRARISFAAECSLEFPLLKLPQLLIPTVA